MSKRKKEFAAIEEDRNIVTFGSAKRKIESYGAKFSVLQYLRYLVIVTISIAAAGFIFQLDYPYIIGTALVGILLILPITVLKYKQRYERYKFENISAYMEYMILNYKTQPKVIYAMSEASKVLTDFRLVNRIRKACDLILNGNAADETGTYALAFNEIERYYPCEIVKQIHKALERLEFAEKDYDYLINLMLADVQKWSNRTRRYQETKMNNKKKAIGNVIVSMIVCAGLTWLLPNKYIEFKSNIIYQITTTAVILAILFTLLVLELKCSKTWLVESYRPKKLIRKNIIKQIKTEFPEWLRSVIISIPTTNVKSAVLMTYKDAPEIIRPAIKEMIEKFRENQIDNAPYSEFLQEYDIAEVSDAMQTLFTLETCSEDDAKIQLVQLAEMNNAMLDEADIIKNTKNINKLNNLVQLPAYICSCKMLIDTATVIYFMVNNAKW